MVAAAPCCSAVVKDVLNVVPSTATAHEIQKCMAACGVALMASSPPQNDVIKFFFYAQEVSYFPPYTYHSIVGSLLPAHVC